MPHIVLEYSQNCTAQIDVVDLLTALHQRLADCETVDLDRIKSRAYASDPLIGGGSKTYMLHCNVKLLDGRPVSLKQAISQQLKKVMDDAIKAVERGPEKFSVTLEISDLDSRTYQG